MTQKSRSLQSILRKTYWPERDARVVVEAWRDSGLSRAEFARHHDIHPERLGRWVRQLNEAPAATFLPVQVVGGSATRAESLEIVLEGNRRVVVERGFDPDLLRQVVTAIESWSC